MKHSFVVLATRTDILVCEHCGIQQDSPYWLAHPEEHDICHRAAVRTSAATASLQSDLFPE